MPSRHAAACRSARGASATDPILVKGLEATAASWPEVRVAFGWVHRAAAILRNTEGLDAAAVRRRYRGLVGAIVPTAGREGERRVFPKLACWWMLTSLRSDSGELGT
jgi:hypothetical protein